MKEIRISPGAQVFTLLALLAAVGAAVAAQVPEIKRYISIKGM